MKWIMLIAAALFFALPTNAAEMVVQQLRSNLRPLISPNGEHFIAYDHDSSGYVLWDTLSGEFLRKLDEIGTDEPLAWSPDEKLLLTYRRIWNREEKRYVNSAVVYSMPSLKLVQILPGMSYSYQQCYFNGITLRTLDIKKNEIKVWRVKDGKLISKYKLRWSTGEPVDDTMVFDDVHFSPNGKFFISKGRAKKVGVPVQCYIWNIETGRLHRQLKMDNQTMVISNDGRYLAIESNFFNRSLLDTSNPNSTQLVNHILYVWDLQDLKIIHSWPFTGYIMRFSADGKYVFTEGVAEDSGRVYNIQTGEFRKVRTAGRNQQISSNDKYWMNSYNGATRITSVQTGKVLSTFPSAMTGGKGLSWSPKGDLLAQGPYLGIWNVKKAIQVENLNLQHDQYKAEHMYWKSVTELSTTYYSMNKWAIDPVGKHFILSTEYLPGSQGIVHKSVNDEQEDIYYYVSISPDGNIILRQKQFKYRKTEEGGSSFVSFDLSVHMKQGISPKDNIIIPIGTNLVYSGVLIWLPDNIRFMVATTNGIEIWNAKTGKKHQTIQIPEIFTPKQRKISDTTVLVKILCISSDGRYVAAANAYQMDTPVVGIWEVATGKLLRIIRGPLSQNASFSHNNQLLAFTGIIDPHGGDPLRPQVEVWHWKQNPKSLLTIKPHGWINEYWQEAPSWSPDSRRFAIATKEDIEIYNAVNGKLLAKLATAINEDTTKSKSGANRPFYWINTSGIVYDFHYPYIRNDWIMWTPQGYFSAPDKGRKRVRWKENGKMIPLDSPRDKTLRTKFYNPQKVAEIIAGKLN